MKIIALTCLGIACALTGNYIAYRLNMRVLLIEKLEIMLNSIICEVNYLSAPVEEIVEALSVRKDLQKLQFLSVCKKQIDSGEDFRSAWKKAVSDKRNVRYLNSEDISILEAFGNEFGTTDSESLISVCKMYSVMVRENLKVAKEFTQRYASLSGGIGLLTGIGVIIVLF